MTDVIPLGSRRFKVAAPGHEKSKAAVLDENQQLRGKLIGMQQLVAGLLLSLPDEYQAEITFKIEDLEQFDPRTVQIEITDTTARLYLSDEKNDTEHHDAS